MNYLIGYLFIGGLITVVLLIHSRVTRDSEVDDVVWKVLSASPAYQTITMRILEKFIVPMIVGSFLIAFWPIALYMKYKTVSDEKKSAIVEEENNFKVMLDDLIEQLTVQQIELLESVIEPLDAVPDLPFGHLNTAWIQFLGNLEEGDVLWSFKSRWLPSWGREEVREGYVVVRNNIVGPWFLSMVKELDDALESSFK